MKTTAFLYLAGSIILCVFSYGFIDPNLVLTHNPSFLRLQAPLADLVFRHRPMAALLYLAAVSLLSGGYFRLWRYGIKKKDQKDTVLLVIAVAVLLFFAFPAFSYDIFNYMTTAKITFTHGENPYIVMPYEITNEPNLAFTRAANKVALYGPVWIGLTAIPHTLGVGKIWLTIVMFKLLVVCAYVLAVRMLYRSTGDRMSPLLFALNPLVLTETLLSGHNDIVMMVFALAGVLQLRGTGAARKLTGVLLVVFSALVKGATAVLFPVLHIGRKRDDAWVWRTSFWVLLGVFLIGAPLREELYPWYGVWFLIFLPLIPRKNELEHWTGLLLSFGLILRHIPYMVSGIYEGVGPAARIVLTVLPLIAATVLSRRWRRVLMTSCRHMFRLPTL